MAFGGSVTTARSGAEDGAACPETRAAPREEVQHRARAFGPDARALSLLIVNLSAQGLMARCASVLPVGARLRIILPVIGVVAAEVRWSHGPDIGCALDHPIDAAEYFELLAAVIRNP